ncbi:amino acid ABC transporter membrane protein (PAAT family) [Streptohalobacillus salinus]|uniref:Amino acid ABC transporter membrane protein (PAAT family) n=1 Tax=Streptohalobacillus salinus TaxID=621096 RepID=A0A2V3W4T5_9BACI|nr:amino acid ABC transporter permease [Streptohalobacillus salinus]PXW89000.1 amino acid ABC transporter membrane protein (PAAT family) [Streptohalobacillus salinus]
MLTLGFFDVDKAIDNLPLILSGFPMTIYVSFLSMAVGLILGLPLALMRSSRFKLLRWPTRVYISFMRGTPVLVLLFIIYFGLPSVDIEFTAFQAAVIGFGFNSAAYIAEVNRAAINSVDDGQWEAAYSLGLTYPLAVTGVILPQAMRIAIPPLTNIFLDLVKASSLAAVITVPELFQKTQIASGRSYDFLTMYILVALLYWPLCVVIAFVQERLEIYFTRFINKKIY